MQPFTLDQSVIAGLLFLLGILIGMYLFAGGKWKRRYNDETTRVRALEAENELLRRDAREMESLRHAAATAPARTTVAEERPVVEELPVVVDRRSSIDRRGPVTDAPDDLTGRRI